MVEKVLYPPTVGNVVETLRSDPEKRFTTLIKALKFTGIIKEISDYSSEYIFSFRHFRSFSFIEMWFIFSAGPWTIFAPTNAAFSNLPILELTNLVKDKARLRRFVFNHLINRSVYSAGLKSHQVLQMANGNNVNIFARRGE